MNHRERLAALGEEARTALSAKFTARERALRRSRETIQHAANTIRAVHRGELEEARDLLESARMALAEVEESLHDHRDVYYAGFVQDAQKEFVEAHATLAFVSGNPLPGPEELGVGFAAYLNGLGGGHRGDAALRLGRPSPRRRLPLRGAAGDDGRGLHAARDH